MPESDGEAAGADGWLESAGLPDGALVGATDGTTTGGEGVAAGVQAMSPIPRPAATAAVAMSLRTMTKPLDIWLQGYLP